MDGNVLQAAVFGSHDHIVQQLLGKGIDLCSIPRIVKPPASNTGYTFTKRPVGHVGHDCIHQAQHKATPN